jgi:hypothetical protein
VAYSLLIFAIDGFQRYKERLLIRRALVKICRERRFIMSIDLKKEMNYKNLGNSCVWLKLYSRQGLLKCIEESHYSEVVGRTPAKYVLNEQ